MVAKMVPERDVGIPMPSFMSAPPPCTKASTPPAFHSEYYFCEVYWPNFRRVDFLRALRSYAQRERRKIHKEDNLLW